MTSSRRLLLLLLGLLGTAVAVKSQRRLSGARPASEQLEPAGDPLKDTSVDPEDQLTREGYPDEFTCPESYGFFADPSHCNKYFECDNNVAKARRCPDGLLFHPERRPYPCVYEQEADCTDGTERQSWQSDGRQLKTLQRNEPECGRQFFVYQESDSTDCGAYVRCSNYQAVRHHCPEGLAYDLSRLVCDYADNVDSCDATAYLNFACPQREFTPAEVDDFTLEGDPDSCTNYFICINKEGGTVEPRLQTCPLDRIFDPASHNCVDPMNASVPGCDSSMRSRAPPPVADPAEELDEEQQTREDEKERRASRLAELRFKLEG